MQNDIVIAQAVWKSAFPRRRPLDEKGAAKLGQNLGWALTWLKTDRDVTSKKMADDETAHLEDLVRCVQTLIGLLSPDKPGTRRLMRQVKDLEAFIDMTELQGKMPVLALAAASALAERKAVKPVHGQDGVSPTDRFIFYLANQYTEVAGKKAGVSTDKEGQRGGPFVRFVQETARQMGANIPSGESIASALRKRSKNGTAKHVIGLVKLVSQ
jgi:hypothetical protein